MILELFLSEGGYRTKMEIRSLWSTMLLKQRKNECNTNHQPRSFQKLTPFREVTLNVYEDALNYVFSDDDIKNIAVSGAYGAGKSSIIETYKTKHPKKKFLHVSLANFNSLDNDARSGTDTNGEIALEGKILNQLIHQINTVKVPLTNFKVKRQPSRWQSLFTSLMSTLMIVDVTYLFDFNKWNKFESHFTTGWLSRVLTWSTSNTTRLVGGVLCATIFVRMLHSVIKFGRNRNLLKRISLQGNEIEIFEQSADSTFFDKHLNEVLYLFENAGVNAIVFEDIDRYNTHEIFARLREISSLVSHRTSRTGKSTLRFFYLLRDDVFASKDRTKFFDFIIPVVPVMDSTNAYDQFLDHFKRGGMDNWFDNTFLEQLSLYVDDMRLLTNIYNEFVVYYDRIKSKELIMDKLLALITYKNVFPQDFSELQLGRGFVHTLFQNKSNIIDKRVSTIEGEIEKLRENMKRIDRECLTTIDELDAVYLVPSDPGLFYIEVNGKSEFRFNTRADFIREMKSENARVQMVKMQNQRVPLNVTTELNRLAANVEYIERKQSIERKTLDWISGERTKIAELEKEKLFVQNGRLRDMITRENIDTLFKLLTVTDEIGREENFNEVKSNHYFRMLKFLLRNGYIDESYSDYMTYFYENSLALGDKNFLLSVTDQKRGQYNERLENAELVASKLRIMDFEQPEVLNFDLLDYLIESQDKNREKFQFFINQLKITKNYEFVFGFLEEDSNSARFINTINSTWPNFLAEAIDKGEFIEYIDNYVVETIFHSSEEDIESVNLHNCLTTYVSGEPSFLQIPSLMNNLKLHKLIDGFRLIHVKFKHINYAAPSSALFNAVYQYDLYAITFETISFLLNKVYGLPTSPDFDHKNLSLVRSKSDEPLAQYVKRNMNEYIGIVLNNCKGLITDDEDVVISLLNDTTIEMQIKDRYLGFLSTKIGLIKDVDDTDIWETLLSKTLAQYNEDNILAYFFKDETSEDRMGSVLVEFISTGKDEMSFDSKSIDTQYGENSTLSFFRAVIKANMLETDRYEALLRGLAWNYNSFSYLDIPTDKMKVLIKLGKLIMTEENLIFLRENYADLVITFIVSNIQKYIELIRDNATCRLLDETRILLETNIPDEAKIELLQYCDEDISIADKNYSDKVKLHILQNNFDATDIPFLFANYASQIKIIRNEIEHITIKHVDAIVEKGHAPSKELLSTLINADELNVFDKKSLFASCLPTLNLMETSQFLNALHMDDFLGLFNRKRPTFENIPVNERILSIFVEKGWINDFKHDGDEIQAFGTDLKKKKHAIGKGRGTPKKSVRT